MTYHLAKLIPRAVSNRLGQYPPLLRQLLFNRNITKVSEVEKFLNPDYEKDLHNPFLMPDMEKAVSRILKAIATKERLAIYSDYDSDGVPGAVILADFLTKIGHTNFIVYIPHRHYEGFGFNSLAAKKLHNDKVTLVVTIDCGSSDGDAVAAAKKLGLDVIITDHHEVSEPAPKALALINPKLNDQYPFPYLCGAAVVFKFIQAVTLRGDFDLPLGFTKWLLDMVGIATIADMVPLRDENRVLAHYGLIVLRKSRRPGIRHLFKLARGNQSIATEDDVGFVIAPRINAASRMGSPKTAFSLLRATTDETAHEYAKQLEKLNQKRKTEVALISRQLNQQIKKLPELPLVLVFGNPEWPPSLAGLSAGKLADTHQRPAFIWGRDGNGVIKGSCRSGNSVSVVDLMTAVKGELIDFGGHHQSGGFSVEQARIHTLREKLNNAYSELKATATIKQPALMVDCELSLNQVDDALIKTLNCLSPYGAENKSPIFLFKSIISARVEGFGRGNEHTKLIFTTGQGQLEAVCFFKQPDDFTKPPIAGEKLNLLAQVEESWFMNRHQIRLKIVDIV